MQEFGKNKIYIAIQEETDKLDKDVSYCIAGKIFLLALHTNCPLHLTCHLPSTEAECQQFGARAESSGNLQDTEKQTAQAAGLAEKVKADGEAIKELRNGQALATTFASDSLGSCQSRV